MVKRYKARLVAKECIQMERLDYFKTFAPMVKMTIVRILLALVIAYNCLLYQIDVTNEFLHGVLHKDMFMPGSFSFN